MSEPTDKVRLTAFVSSQNNQICHWYNPYFGNGCPNGTDCKFRHLKEKDFIAVCTRISKTDRPSNAIRNTFRSAIDLLKKGRANKALEKFEQICESCPYDELYNMWYARCHEELGNYEDAEFYYRRSIAIQPKFATAHGRYAEFSWHKLNNIKQAKVHFEKSLNNKENHVTHRHYAQFMEQNFNDYKTSQYHFERCLKLSPNDHGAHHSYAIVLQKMGASVGKIRYHYDRAIELYECSNVHYSYALYLKNIKKNEEALNQFLICLDFDSHNAMYHFQCGLFLIEQMNQFDQGLEYLNNAQSIAPTDNLYKETYEKFIKLAQQKNVTKNVQIVAVDDYDGLFENFKEEKSEMIINSEALCKDFNDILGFEVEGKSKKKKKHQCEIEFERFIREQIAFGSFGNVYIERFDEKQINDIRILEFIDYAFLKNEIKMNEMHIRLMLNKIEKVKRDIAMFSNWLQSMRLYDEYHQILEVHGIITFDLFYHHIKSAQDVVDMIGKENLTDAMFIFNHSPRKDRQNAIGQSNRFAM